MQDGFRLKRQRDEANAKATEYHNKAARRHFLGISKHQSYPTFVAHAFYIRSSKLSCRDTKDNLCPRPEAE